MSMFRMFTLLLGPVLLVGLSYRLTMIGLEGDGTAAASSVSRIPPAVDSGGAPASGSTPTPLAASCQDVADRLRPRLTENSHILVRPPYVLAGDLSEADLKRCYRDLIAPIARVLSLCYFDHPPDEPVTILMFSGNQAYQQHARQFDGRSRPHYYGYYQRSDRRIVLNLATGNGTLAHELTHALAHFDFPSIPEWFDEGLATLHEQSRFSEDGAQLEGLSNWRLNHLLHAIRRDRLPPLESLVTSRTFRPQAEATDYAHARYFCLYLQQRRLLIPFYRKFRAAADRDPTGFDTLRDLLDVASLSEVDGDFRRWAEGLHRPKGKGASAGDG